MKVEPKFKLEIKDSSFELSREEAESLYYELQKALGLMPVVNIPSTWPDWRTLEQPFYVTSPSCDDPVPPFYTISCAEIKIQQD